MRRFLVIIILLLGLQVYAENVRVAPNMYHVKREVTDEAIIDCFAYFNEENAKLKGRVFEMEYNCLYNYGGYVETSESVFYYGTTTDYVTGKPYYFSRQQIFEIMLRNNN